MTICHTVRKSLPASSVPTAFFCKQKNKHLTPAIFGGAPFSWRATREANKQFQKHANFQYTAENRLATFCLSFGLWLTIWKANKSALTHHQGGISAARYNPLHFAIMQSRVNHKCGTPAPRKGTPCPLTRYRNAAQFDHNMLYLIFTCVCCYNKL